MARVRKPASRTRKSPSRSWLKSVVRFRERFPRLLRTDFWRSRDVSALWQSVFGPKRKPAKRRRGRRLECGWGEPLAIRPEALEPRVMLSISAGNLDTKFNLSGMVTTDFGTGDTGSQVAFDKATGDIIVAGTSNAQFALAAYKADGSLDANFGPNHTGLVTLAIGTSDQANALAIDGSGNILVAGFAVNTGSGEDFALAKFTATGSLDHSFGTGGSGYVTTDLNSSSQDVANAIALDGHNGDIILAGQTGPNQSAGAQHAAVVAYTGSGALDTGFGSGGVFRVTTGAADVAMGVTTDSSGNVLTAGYSGAQAELISINSTGSSGTRHQITLGATSIATSIAADGGNYLIAGSADGNFVLAEVNSSGGFIGGFGTAGKVETVIGNGSEVNAIAVQTNGQIVVAWSEIDPVSSFDFFALARYSSAGVLDGNFGSGGVVTSDLSGTASANSVAGGVAIQPNGLIVAAGYTEAEINPPNFAVTRYVANNAPTAAHASTTFTAIDQGQVNNPGDSVSSLIAGIGASDVDGDPLALAVTAVDDSNGTWQYSTNSGGSWTSIPAVSDSSALYLTGAAGNRIRFVPNLVPSEFYSNGTTIPDPTITLRAADQSQQSPAYANASLVNAFSSSMADTTADSGPDGQNLDSFSDSTSTASVRVQQLNAVVYVNSAWANNMQGDTVTDGFGTHTFGIDAFATVQNGVTFVAADGTVHVDAGTYAENVTISQSLSLLGPNAGVDGNAGLGRAAEAIIEPASGSSYLTSNVITVAASNVTIDGLTIDGSNGALGNTGTQLIDGTWSQAGYGISNATGVDNNSETPATAYDISNLTVRNNIVENTAQGGIYGNDSNLGATTGNTITRNLIENISANTADSFGYGIYVLDNFYAAITGNHVVGAQNAIQVENFSQADPNAGPTQDLVDGNVVDYYHRGIFLNLQYESASPFTISNNQITVDAAAPAFNKGLSIESVQSAVSETISDNNVTGAYYGYDLWNLTTSNTVVVSGGIVNNTTYGVWATNNSEFGLGAASAVTISGVSITNASAAGIYVEGDIGAGTATMAATINEGTSISGSPTGILLLGGNASATIDTAAVDPTTIGIDLEGGSASINNVTFSGNTLDLKVGAGSTLTALTNSSFTSAPVHRQRSLRRDRRHERHVQCRDGECPGGRQRFEPHRGIRRRRPDHRRHRPERPRFCPHSG